MEKAKVISVRLESFDRSLGKTNQTNGNRAK